MNKKTRYFIIQYSDNQRMLKYSGKWHSSVGQYMRNKNVQHLDISACDETNLSFLNEIDDILTTLTIGGDISDISAIGKLSNLKDLRSDCTTKTKLDLSGLKTLKECSIWWQKSFTYGLFNVKSLKYLDLTLFHPPDLKCFSKLENLACLRLERSRMKSFNGIELLKELKELYLDEVRYAEDYDLIGELKQLEKVFLYRCRSITNYNFLKNLKNLKRLILSDHGEIPSINFISELPNLELFTFGIPNNKATITDRDLSPIIDHPRLKAVSFFDHKKYNYTEIEIKNILSQRHGNETVSWDDKPPDKDVRNIIGNINDIHIIEYLANGKERHVICHPNKLHK